MSPDALSPDRAESATHVALRAAAEAGVDIVELHDAEAMALASTLWATIWGSDPTGLQMHPGLLVALAHTGNYVAGAFVGGRLVGAAAGFFHSPDQRTLHSHIAGVLPDHTRRGVARALKLHQAAWCLQRGVTRVTWTFDPLVARNARFNLVTLGTSVVSYVENLYGTMTDALNAGHPTDRLMVSWDLTGAPAATAWPPPGAGGPLFAASETEAGVDSPAADWTWCTTAVPADIEALRRDDPDRAATWRTVVRAAFTMLDDAGWRVVGFDEDAGYHWQKEEPDALAGR